MVNELLSSSNILSSIVTPKIESSEELNLISSHISSSSSSTSCGLLHGIWGMVETARGVLNVDEICSNSSLTTLIIGTADLGKDLRVEDEVLGLFIYSLSSYDSLVLCVNLMVGE